MRNRWEVSKLKFFGVSVVIALLSFFATYARVNRIQSEGRESGAATTFTVNLTGDESDSAPGSGGCDIDPITLGFQCTLRAALEEANAHPGVDSINFNVAAVGVPTISPGSALPTITEAVVIDGTTQPTGNRIELNGSGAGFANGLVISAGGSTVKGLVINRFGNNGIGLVTSGGNVLVSNFIGTDVTGGIALGNGQSGVHINNSPDNIIGGTAAAERNIISGNGMWGVRIQGSSATKNLVQGNFIGTDVRGVARLGNGLDGVIIGFASDNTVGGTTAGTVNIISGNGQSGVFIAGNRATGNVVQGNFIGTDVTGTGALGNSSSGVAFDNAPNNTVGGRTPGARNVISGNNQSGVLIAGSKATGNLVQGNFIGTDVTGAGALGNSGSGVTIDNVSNDTVGGTAAGARNVISGNNQSGVEIGGIVATGNVVLGNCIGTDVTGTAALGNSYAGIFIRETAENNTLGGTVAGARNVISGNERYGVVMAGGATGTIVAGNFIGTDITGTVALGNAENGVSIFGFSSNNTIGGGTEAAGNTIAFNGNEGMVVDLTSRGNSCLHNSIFSNGARGIDLFPGGVTLNDLGDVDAGSNDLQNFPVFTSAGSVGATVTVQGSLNSRANGTFTLEFFASDSCDPSGYGEGQNFFGSVLVTTDGSGNASFNVTFPVAVAAGKFITATATDSEGNTSEFSQCLTVCALSGDVTNDAVIDIVDLAALVQDIVFGLPLPNPAAGDANCDGVRDIVDVVGLIQYVVFGSPTPCCL